MIQELKIKACNLYNSIPLAFDESLSYLEELSAILSKLNEVIVQVNYNTEFMQKYVDQYDEVKKLMEELIIDINNRFEEIESDLNDRFINLTDQVIALIDNNYTILKNYIDERDAYLEDKIDHISIDSIVLRDPTTGLFSNIQVVINNLFNTLVTDAITTSEFDSLDLTASGFEAYQITAYDFDTQAKIILV